MDLTRRDLLKAGVTSAVLATLPRPLLAQVRGVPEPMPPITDPTVKELALRAVDAARRAGASYTDVRLTYTRQRSFGGLLWFRTAPDAEALHVGVRALVNGYWGFASSGIWAKDEMDRLGQQAAALAKVGALGKGRVVELASTPVVQDGNWVTPMKIDPFEVSPFEITDYVTALEEYVTKNVKKLLHATPSQVYSPSVSYDVVMQEKAFASSDGSYCTQRLQRGFPNAGITLMVDGQPKCTAFVDQLPRATSAGYEIFKDQPIRDYLVQLVDTMIAEFLLPETAVEVGRYDAVCDAWTVAALMHSTLSAAAQLDRAFGYEANATGTSYLNDPNGMIGSYLAGAPELTMIGERKSPGGAASVQWDDEGVTPEEFPIVKEGVLVDFQTTRESAAWLKDRYAARSMPLRSHGCANVETAVTAPIQTAPNLHLLPGKELDFTGLVTNVRDGIAIKQMLPADMKWSARQKRPYGSIDMDFQALNGIMIPRSYLAGRILRIKNGRPIARIEGGSVMFRAPELWRGLTALGNEASVRAMGIREFKGEPEQSTYHTVTAPAVAFKQLTLTRDQ